MNRARLLSTTALLVAALAGCQSDKDTRSAQPGPSPTPSRSAAATASLSRTITEVCVVGTSRFGDDATSKPQFTPVRGVDSTFTHESCDLPGVTGKYQLRLLFSRQVSAEQLSPVTEAIARAFPGATVQGGDIEGVALTLSVRDSTTPLRLTPAQGKTLGRIISVYGIDPATGAVTYVGPELTTAELATLRSVLATAGHVPVDEVEISPAKD